MPEVTRLGFYLQKYTNALLESIKSAAELGGGDEDTVEQEFIVEQLLHIAQTLDYTDEAGRRKMFSLLREALTMGSPITSSEIPNVPRTSGFSSWPKIL